MDSARLSAGRPARRLRTFAFGAIVLLVAAGITALGGVSLWRKVQTFAPIGFQTSASATGLEVLQSSLPGLNAGDRVLLANGQQVADPRALHEILAAKPDGRLLVSREGDLVEVDYQRPPLAIDPTYVLLAVAGIAYLIVGLYTSLRRRSSPAGVFFAWCAAWAVVGIFSPTLGFSTDLLGRAIYLVEEIAVILLAPLTLHLFLRFPSAARGAGRTAIAFAYVPATALMALHLDLAFTGGRWLFGRVDATSLAVLDRIDLAHWAVFAVASLVALFVRRREGQAEERRQRQWILAGLAAGYLPFLALYVLPWSIGARPSQWLSAIAVAPLLLAPLAFAYAILRHRLWDLGAIVRDASVSALTVLLAVLGFSLANLAIARGVPADLGVLRSALTFIAGVTIAATLVPARRSLNFALGRLHHGIGYGRRRALADFGREILEQRDLDALCASLLTRVEECFDLRRANLYLAQAGHLVRVRPDQALPAQWSLNAMPEEIWDRDHVVLNGLTVAGLAPSAGERMFAAGYRYASPLALRGNPVGVLLLGYRAGESPLSSEDLDLVRGLLDQASLAIENAQLVDQLHRQLEETTRLRRFNEGVIESSPAGIAVLDRERRVTSANLAFAALVGLERPAILGIDIARVLPVDLPAPSAESADTNDSTTRREGLLEVSWCDLVTGGERHLQIGLSPLAGSAGALVLVVQDVTERMNIEAEMREKDRLAALGMLAAGVAHEVNTPITGISSYAQMLLSETAESDPRYEILKKVERQTFRASRIVNSLLDFARDKSGEMVPVDLPQLLREAAELLRERLAARRVTLSWGSQCEAAQVLGNDGELQQVFTNLMLNAMEALNGQPGGELRLSLETAADKVTATIEDNGPGIPAAVLERIFQPFFSTKIGQGGTGLGLSVTHGIVRRHGGDIRVDSQVGRGTRFTIELPRLAGEGKSAHR
jgi:two-component system NtrC family sensor kinase